MKGFLYGETEFNILDNAVHLDEYISYAEKMQFDFLSITDRNLSGHMQFYNKCMAKGIKPVIGLEVNLERDNYIDTFLIYPFNNAGYRDLLRLSSMVELGKLNLDLLVKLSKNSYQILVAMKSIVERSISGACPYEGRDALEEYSKIFNHLYLGVTFQVNQKREINKEAAALARDLGILSVYIHELKYLYKEDRIVYDFLYKLKGHSDNPIDGDFSFYDSAIENDIEALEFIENTNELVKSINLDLFKEKVRMPKFPLDGISAKDYLFKLASKGLNRRLATSGIRNNKPYLERLNKELKVINDMQFNDYFLIVWDFIRYAKKNGVLVGPGRGSAASSLVAYSLGITDIDPLKYDLLFERFLNPERVSMPDIDTDFPDNKRDMVIKYVKDFYGENHVSSITTFGTFSLKSSVRDLGRVLKIENKIIKEIVKLVEENNDFDKLLAEFTYRPDVYNFLYILKRLDGLPRNISTHAAGIIISDIDLMDVIPFQEGPNGILQSQLQASELESLGLLKMDFLGIKNLTIIDNILKEINKDAKWLREINLNDKNVLELLSNADTLGVFQLESRGIRIVLTKLKPSRFEDLVAVLALYRPGPMDNIDEFIARRHGKRFEYLHPDLEPILKDTYGIIVYQEQIIKIACKFASYSLGQADILRRAVSKKKLDVLEAERDKFVGSAMNTGYSMDISNKIYDYIVKFANYGFNKAHSVAYAVVSYQMAYLKTYYFSNFMANILNNVIGSQATTASYLNYAKNHGVRIMAPNINISTDKFVSYKNSLYLPFTAILGIGNQVTKEILEARANGIFNDFNNFKERCPFVNSNAMEGLIFTSALDCFKKTKKALMESKSLEISLMDKLLGDVKEEKSEYEEAYLSEMEFKYLGYYINYDPTKYLALIRKKHRLLPLSKQEQYMTSVVKFKNLNIYVTKNKKTILRGLIYDDTRELEFVIFNDLYNEVLGLINEDGTYIVDIQIKSPNDGAIIRDLKPIKEKN